MLSTIKLIAEGWMGGLHKTAQVVLAYTQSFKQRSKVMFYEKVPNFQTEANKVWTAGLCI